jgi:hypothetical protein
MSQSLEAIIAELNAFEASEWEGENEERLQRLIDSVDLRSNREVVIPILFHLVERNPEALLGSPGPIVHSLEAVGGYEAALRESLHRRPTPLTVWMVNRLLNSDLSPHERRWWLGDLRRVLEHSTATEGAKRDAGRFLDYQGRRPA